MPDNANTGLLVALWLDAEAADTLAVAGGESADDLHVTLCYVPSDEPPGDLTVARTIAAIEREVSWRSTLVGKVGGYGRFLASDSSDGQDVFYAAVDVPGLAELRDAVTQALNEAYGPPSARHGYTPHITLAYLDPDADNPVERLPATELRFGAVTVIANGRRIDIPLGPPLALFALRDDGEQPLTHVYQPAVFAEPPEWSPFLPVPGVYDHPVYGTLDFTAETYARIIDHFTRGIYQDRIPVTVQHEQYSSAVGWITDMRLAESGAIEAKVDWNERGKKLIADDRYLYVSAEIAFTWTPPDEPETVYEDVAFGLTLCTNPYFKERVLPPLAASEAVLTRHAGESGKEVSMGDQVTQEQQTPPADEQRQTEDTPVTQMTEPTTPAARPEGQTAVQLMEVLERQSGEVRRLTDLVSTRDREIARLTEDKKALERTKRRQHFTDVALGRTSGSDGLAFVGDVEDHVALLTDLAERHGDDSEQVSRYVRMQKAHAEQAKASGLFREIGTGRSGEAVTPQDQIEAIAKRFRELDPQLSEAQAYSRAVAENPQLYVEYLGNS